MFYGAPCDRTQLCIKHRDALKLLSKPCTEWLYGMSDDDTFVCVTPDTLHLSQYVAYVEDDSAGAVATFSGVTRNVFQGKKVIQLVYEAYDDMAGKIMRVSPALWFALQPRPYAGSWQKRIWTSCKATSVDYGQILMPKQCQRLSSASFP